MAAADGPDFYKVHALAPGAQLQAYAQPDIKSAKTATFEAREQCLRNLGCQGGLTLEEFTTLPDAEKKKHAEARPRWCKVSTGKKSGWVQARFLSETGCTAEASHPLATKTWRGTLRGWTTAKYSVPAHAGQRLTLTLQSSNPQNYFNVTAPGAELAMFVGHVSGERLERVAPVAGEYQVEVYLMRPAARRNESSNYILKSQLDGAGLRALPAVQDALVAGSPYHASAQVPCKLGSAPEINTCAAYVIRYDREGSATVEIRWTGGTWQRTRRMLFVNGQAVSSDSTDPIRASRMGETTAVDIGGDERFELPDALLQGG